MRIITGGGAAAAMVIIKVLIWLVALIVLLFGGGKDANVVVEGFMIPPRKLNRLNGASQPPYSVDHHQEQEHQQDSQNENNFNDEKSHNSGFSSIDPSHPLSDATTPVFHDQIEQVNDLKEGEEINEEEERDSETNAIRNILESQYNEACQVIKAKDELVEELHNQLWMKEETSAVEIQSLQDEVEELRSKLRSIRSSSSSSHSAGKIRERAPNNLNLINSNRQQHEVFPYNERGASSNMNRQVQAATAASETLKRLQMEEEMANIKQSMKGEVDEIMSRLRSEQEARAREQLEFKERVAAEREFALMRITGALEQAERIDATIDTELGEYLRENKVLREELDKAEELLHLEKEALSRERLEAEERLFMQLEEANQRHTAAMESAKREKSALIEAKLNETARQYQREIIGLQELSEKIEDHLRLEQEAHSLEQQKAEEQLAMLHEESSQRYEDAIDRANKKEAALKAELKEKEEQHQRDLQLLQESLQKLKNQVEQEAAQQNTSANIKEEDIGVVVSQRLAAAIERVERKASALSEKFNDRVDEYRQELLMAIREELEDERGVGSLSDTNRLEISVEAPPASSYTPLTSTDECLGSPEQSCDDDGTDYLHGLSEPTTETVKSATYSGFTPKPISSKEVNDYLSRLNTGPELILKTAIPENFGLQQQPMDSLSTLNLVQPSIPELIENADFNNPKPKASESNGYLSALQNMPSMTSPASHDEPSQKTSIDNSYLKSLGGLVGEMKASYSVHGTEYPRIATGFAWANSWESSTTAPATRGGGGRADYISPLGASYSGTAKPASYSGFNPNPHAPSNSVDNLSSDSMASQVPPGNATKEINTASESEYMSCLGAPSDTFKAAPYPGLDDGTNCTSRQTSDSKSLTLPSAYSRLGYSFTRAGSPVWRKCED